MANPLRLMDVARAVVDEVAEFQARMGTRVIHDKQLRESSQSIVANIREAYGRRIGAERNQFLRFARGSAEETDEHLRANFRRNRLSAKTFWRLHNRLAVIVKILNALLGD